MLSFQTNSIPESNVSETLFSPPQKSRMRIRSQKNQGAFHSVGEPAVGSKGDGFPGWPHNSQIASWVGNEAPQKMCRNQEEDPHAFLGTVSYVPRGFLGHSGWGSPWSPILQEWSPQTSTRVPCTES